MRHVLLAVCGLFLLLGVPFLRTDYAAALLSGQTDAVSAATMILDQPSGEYLILINTRRHRNQENLATWNDFFSGREISFLFEDLVCAVAKGDAGGLEMARSYQSRLPEHQMEIRTEDGTLLISKAEYGKFDVIVLSAEMADALAAETVASDPEVDVIRVKGGAE